MDGSKDFVDELAVLGCVFQLEEIVIERFENFAGFDHETIDDLDHVLVENGMVGHIEQGEGRLWINSAGDAGDQPPNNLSMSSCEALQPASGSEARIASISACEDFSVEPNSASMSSLEASELVEALSPKSASMSCCDEGTAS